ncbi:hypothetical protein [Ruania rhizosphaerae]|uniref:hypothetical protein n=1 Tax=Ruania rhizosphaerae TaxID=1840413 RepID=UPI00135C74E9|nr:hypothetical protein [Ruania rhizosphaerae]
MIGVKAPQTELEWSRRAIINVVDVLAVHAESLTLIGAHAVLLRTMDLDVPRMPTGDGDLGVTPGLVGDLPSIEALLADAGYEHRTTARPGLWGRESYDEQDGTRSFREKVDLLAPHGLSGTASRTKRSVPALQPAHGKLAVGNALGLELAAFNRSLVTLTDFADPRLSAEIHVAEIPALILAKGSKIGERLRESRKGRVRDKDLGDLWRLMAVAEPSESARVIEDLVRQPEVGLAVRQSLEWTDEVLRDPASAERAKLAFDTFVDPAEIDHTFDMWRSALAG